MRRESFTTSRSAFGVFLPEYRNAVGGKMLRPGGYEVIVSLKQKDLWAGRYGLTVCPESSMLQRDDDNAIHRGGVETPLTSGKARSMTTT